MDSYATSSYCSADRAREISRLFALMIVQDLRPLQIVGGEGFKALVAFCEPNYDLPRRKFVTCYREHMHADLISRMKSVLTTTEFLSLTSDIWTSAANESYMSVTAHFIDNSWCLNRMVLPTLPLEDTHTGDHIASSRLLGTTKYPPQKLSQLYLTTDQT